MTSHADWKAAVEREIAGTPFERVMHKTGRTEALYTSLSRADEVLAKEVHALIVEPRPLVRTKVTLDNEHIGLSPALAIALQLGSADLASDENVTFSVPIGTDIWTEVAKLRALRLGWAKLQLARNRTLKWAHIVATGMSPALTLREPWVNLLRNAHVAFAALVGGADDFVLAPFDYGYRPHSELGRRIALNVRHVLEEEGRVAKVKDPAHGSFAIESMMCGILRQAWSILELIDAAGGYESFVLTGAMRALVDDDHSDRREALRAGAVKITGITSFADCAPEELNGYPGSVLGEPVPALMQWSDEAAIKGGA